MPPLFDPRRAVLAFRPHQALSLLAALVAFAVAGGWGIYRLQACGPFGQTWIIDDERHLLVAPDLRIAEATSRIRAQPQPPFRAQGAGQSTAKEIEASELLEQLAALGQPPARQLDVVEAVRLFRATLPPLPLVRTESSTDVVPGAALQAAQSQDPPAGLPLEFWLYLRGAAAYRRGESARAEQDWRTLLTLHRDQRRYRSTWAAYMLGRSSLETRPLEAIDWFHHTRALAGEGFADPLGLAAATYGWEARIALEAKRYEEAFDLYRTQRAAGDDGAEHSLRILADRLLADPPALDRAVRSSQLRRLLVDYTLTLEVGRDDNPTARKEPPPLCAALVRAHLGNVDDADRIAWATYKLGDFTSAAAWLELAPAGSPIAGWIRAKLLVREGKLAAAAELLESLRSRFPAGPPANANLLDLAQSDRTYALRPRLDGEIGFLHLATGRYEDALLALARGSYWEDAAYVAERVLTVDELRSLVDRQFPARLAARAKRDSTLGRDILAAGLVAPSLPDTANQMRHLLARRLSRNGHFRLAASYFSGALRRDALRLAATLESGKGRGAARAEALFAAACLFRHRGIDLLASELDPDWRSVAAAYELPRSFATRTDLDRHSWSLPTQDETRRVRASAIAPERRFHYRYRAAELARKAAQLLPAGSRRRAEILATAGTWLKVRDPTAAEPLYRELVHCCGATAIGGEARRRHWLPTVEVCPAETLDLESNPPRH